MRVTRPIGLLDGTALLAAPSDFAKDAIERALREPITEALSRRLGRPVSLAVKVDPVTPAAAAGARANGNGGGHESAPVGTGMDVSDPAPGPQLALGPDGEVDPDGEEV